MDFIIRIIESGLNYELIFSVMRDFRIGGLNPDNYDKFIKRVRKFPDIVNSYFPPSKDVDDYLAITDPTAKYQMKLHLMKINLTDLNLTDVNPLEINKIWNRVVKLIVEDSKACWHPEASILHCTKNSDGKVKISNAHSIQRNKILKSISENHKVTQFKLNSRENNISFPIKSASTFFGFCDKHDKIFDPIEKQDYVSTDEQNFLFAYRAFVHSSHIKLVFNEFMDFGLQSENDMIAEKRIFDKLILTNDYKRVRTDKIILDYNYPIASTSSSDLDFDFNSKNVYHSEARMERFYLTVFPQNVNTYILFSYFEEDSNLYGDIINQIIKRGKIETDLSVLLSGHCENTFFKPSYYNKYIKPQEKKVNSLIRLTQFDFVPIDGYGKKTKPISLTPSTYLNNSFNIQLFFK